LLSAVEWYLSLVFKEISYQTDKWANAMYYELQIAIGSFSSPTPIECDTLKRSKKEEMDSFIVPNSEYDETSSSYMLCGGCLWIDCLRLKAKKTSTLSFEWMTK